MIKISLLTLLFIFGANQAASAQQMTDEQIRRAIVHYRYWQEMPNVYVFNADGTWQECPAEPTSRHGIWKIKDGFYYQGNEEGYLFEVYKVITVNDREFLFQIINGQYAGTVHIYYRTDAKHCYGPFK